MHDRNLGLWQHEHTFGQERRRPAESRTMLVICITLAMMAAEIAAGLSFGSMALLADGMHMASHAVALGISALAYAYARRHAGDSSFCFGTGKVNALGGFTGALLLLVFALVMAWESVVRVLSPVPIAFDQAILVAVLGLAVNGASALILSSRSVGQEQHSHAHHGSQQHHGHHQHHDHNLRSAYLHVLADALTSVLAIVALVAGKYLGLLFVDPAMGILGAALVARWSVGLMRSSASVLLDRQGPESIAAALRSSLERDGETRVADLHLWSVGPGIYGAIVSVVSARPLPPSHYKDALPPALSLAHVTVEVHPCTPEGPAGERELAAASVG